MTLLFAGLCLVFGFFAFRHFRNGRMVWAAFAGLGCLLMIAAVWVDFQRASGAGAGSAASVEPTSSSSDEPVIQDYRPPAAEGESAAGTAEQQSR